MQTPAWARPFAVTVVVVLVAASLAQASPPDARPAPKKPDAKKPAKPAPPPLSAKTRDFHQQHLDIWVTPNWETQQVVGRVKHTFVPLRDGFRTLRLHCQDTKVRGVKDGKGAALPYEHRQHILAIRFPAVLPKDEPCVVEIHYQSTPRRGLYFHRPSERHPDRPVFLYSQGQGTDNRRWIPCYDAPDDRTSWDLHVTVPASLTTVSNGTRHPELPSETKGELRTDHWRFASRAPTYLISLIVGQFETVTQEVDGVLLEFNGPVGRKEELTTSLAITAEMMRFFGAYLDLKYPWPRYAQTYVWDFVYGGMENVTATTLNMRALHHRRARPNYRSDGLVAHELAHMWFGDLLTCRTWEHIWLNEGFATYFTDLFFEHKYGREEFLLRRRTQNRRYMNETPDVPKLKLTRSPRGDTPIELSGGKAYSRGAGILHNLRSELGDTVFRDAMRAYVHRFRDQAVTSEDLRRTVEDVAGRDLKWFWDQWVYGAGYPNLQVQVDHGTKTLTVRQLQPRAGGQGLFRLRVPVQWGPNAQTVRVYREVHQFQLPELKGDASKWWFRFGTGGDLLMAVQQNWDASAWALCLRNDPDFTGRMDAAEGLEKYGDVGEPALARALQEDPVWAVRELCAQILGRLQGPAALPALRAAARDADSRVRAAVQAALGNFTRDQAADLTLEAAANDPHPYVRAAAAEAAGRVKARGADKVLADLLQVDSHIDVVRAGALKGLRALGDPAGARAALRFLDYKWGRGANHSLRQTALDCVTALAPDDPVVRRAIVGLLDDPYHRMREWAAKACGSYAIDEALPRLKQLAKDDWHGGVKRAAQRAAKDIEAAAKKKK